MRRRGRPTKRTRNAVIAIQRWWRGRKKPGIRRNYGLPSARTGYLAVQQKHVVYTACPAGGGSTDVFVDNLKFNIGQLDNLPSYQRLFDQYRIKKVVVKMTQQSGFAPGNPTMTLITSIDLDAGTAPTGAISLLQCSNAKTKLLTQFSPSRTVSIYPRFQNVIALDPTAVPPTQSFSIGKSGAWLDLADQGLTNHHGLNICFTCPDATGLAIDCLIRYEYTYHVEFRKIR